VAHMTWKKIFRKFGQKRVRVSLAVMRDMNKSPAEISLFLEETMRLIRAGHLSNVEFSNRQRAFHGDNPTFMFVGYAALDKELGEFRIIDTATGEFLGKPLAGDLVWPVHEFEEARQRGDIKLVA
jgi:hypothetical protein